MTSSLTLSIPSDLASVAPAARAVRAACAGLLPAGAIDDVEIAVVEAINNVITHGYGGRPGEDIGLRLGVTAEAVVIEILDHAPPMRPALIAGLTGQPTPGGTARTFAREGGRGIALIRLTMDEIAYRSEGGENRLRLTKKRPRP